VESDTGYNGGMTTRVEARGFASQATAEGVYTEYNSLLEAEEAVIQERIEFLRAV